MNLANSVTLFRILALSFIIFSLLQDTLFYSILTVLLFLLTILSDILDGYLARKRKEVTEVGSFLDPIADKLVIYVLLIFFWKQGFFFGWMILTFVGRDALVNWYRLLARRKEIELEELTTRVLKGGQFTLILLLIMEQLWLQVRIKGMLMHYSVLTFSWAVLSIAFISLVSVLYAYYAHREKKTGKTVEQEKILILANPRSRGFKDLYRRRLLKIFSRRRKAPILYLPPLKNMYEGIEKKLGAGKHIVIAGGDGSFESALNYRPLQKKSLGFFPLGAGNAFWSYFYKGNRHEYLRSRFQFRELKMDVLELEYDGKKRQTLFGSIGLDAEVLHLARERTRQGFFDYVTGTWRVAFGSTVDYDLTVSVDGKKQRWMHSANVTLAKIPYYGYAIRSLIRAAPNDGKVYGLAVVNTHAVFWNKMLRGWGLMLTALGLAMPPLVELCGKEIVIESKKPLPVQAGGEFLGYSTYVKVRVVRKQKVLVI